MKKRKTTAATFSLSRVRVVPVITAFLALSPFLSFLHRDLSSID